MGNMSYCRFQNTEKDLVDCLDAMRTGEADDDKLSKDELQAKKNLIQTCREILEETGVYCEEVEEQESSEDDE